MRKLWSHLEEEEEDDDNDDDDLFTEGGQIDGKLKGGLERHKKRKLVVKKKEDTYKASDSGQIPPGMYLQISS